MVLTVKLGLVKVVESLEWDTMLFGLRCDAELDLRWVLVAECFLAFALLFDFILEPIWITGSHGVKFHV